MPDTEQELEFEDISTQEDEVLESKLSEEDKDSVIKSLRDENAKARIRLKKLDEAEVKLKEIEREKMTALERAEDEARELREQLKPLLFEKDLKKAVKASGLDPDFAELLEGRDYDSYDDLLSSAQKLAKKLPASVRDREMEIEESRPRATAADFLGGSSGRSPVTSDGVTGGDFLRGMWGNSKPAE